MLAFVLMFTQMGRGLRRSWRDPGFRALLVILVCLLSLGTFFYHRIEGWSYVDSLYFCVVAISTVGFGDFTPQTTVGKLFTIGFLLCGVGVFVSIVGTLAVNLAYNEQEKAPRKWFRQRRIPVEEHPESR